MDTMNDEFNFKSKSNNNFNLKEKNSKVPEGLNNYKHCLPSFLVDDYFQQGSDCDNDSSEDKDDIKKNNSFDNTKEEKNNSKNLLEGKKTENTSNNEEIKSNILYNNNNNINNINNNMNNMNNISDNNLINNNSPNLFNPFPLYQEKNMFTNSFNNTNPSTYYYQNYLNSINKMNNIPSLEPNYNILNNNINIINNNNFMNQKNNPFFNINNNSNNINYPQTFSFNSPPTKKYFNQSMNEINTQNYMNNLMFNGDLNQKKNKIFTANSNWNKGPIQIHKNMKNENFSDKNKKMKKKNKKESKEENNIVKKMLNMSDYSLCNFLKNQKDSREAQNALVTMKENEVDVFINKLKNFISDVTIDKYGNYFTQKLIQICVPSQRLKIIQNINTHFVEIANNSFGTHPLQSLMEIINMPEEKRLILKYILGNETILSFDSRGTHILQKYIINTKDEDRGELNNNIVNLIDKLITDISGVCVLIKLIKHTKDKIILEKIANYITNNEPLFFIQHPYANYAVQILIMNPIALPFCNKIIETIVNNYLSLSMQNFRQMLLKIVLNMPMKKV